MKSCKKGYAQVAPMFHLASVCYDYMTLIPGEQVEYS